MKLTIYAAVISAFLFTACNKKAEVENPVTPTITHHQPPQFMKEGELTFFKPDGSAITRIDIEIAETPAEQEQGLMNRPFMNNENGMLFIFNRDEERGFWMRNTIIPLDILYVNSKMQIVSIAVNTEPYSERSIPSGRPAQYVVEVNAGFCAQYGISVGCGISFSKM